MAFSYACLTLQRVVLPIVLVLGKLTKNKSYTKYENKKLTEEDRLVHTLPK